MTMHLHHPSLSLTGKKKGKIKFRNAEEAQRSRELDAEWKALQKKWGVEAEEKKRKRGLDAEVWQPTIVTYRGASDRKIQSIDTGWTPCVKKAAPIYTGDKIIGIATMHKSNAVPVFSNEQALDISKMRR